MPHSRLYVKSAPRKIREPFKTSRFVSGAYRIAVRCFGHEFWPRKTDEIVIGAYHIALIQEHVRMQFKYIFFSKAAQIQLDQNCFIKDVVSGDGQI